MTIKFLETPTDAPKLFQKISLRQLEIKNRIWLAPMCQYSADTNGLAQPWHFAHYGARAIGGFGLLIQEATGISPEGRISNHDLGLWNPEQATALKPIIEFVHSQGAKMGIQLGHAGRKASTYGLPARPGTIPQSEGGWQTLAPSAVAMPGLDKPIELDQSGIDKVITDFANSAKLAVETGYDLIELHAAHGYLIHQFLSPLSNFRTDQYGGSLENRARLLLEVIEAVRAVIPKQTPILVRFSATDWLPEGLVASDIATVASWAKASGADLFDISTGGLLPAEIPIGPGYQVASALRVAESEVPVTVVGLIEKPEQAENLLADPSIAAILIGRAGLRDPNWPLRAAFELGYQVPEIWPQQYLRAMFR